MAEKIIIFIYHINYLEEFDVKIDQQLPKKNPGYATAL